MVVEEGCQINYDAVSIGPAYKAALPHPPEVSRFREIVGKLVERATVALFKRRVQFFEVFAFHLSTVVRTLGASHWQLTTGVLSEFAALGALANPWIAESTAVADVAWN